MPLKSNENEYILLREYEEDTSKQKHNKDSCSDDLYFTPILSTPESKFDFTASIINNFHAKLEDFSQEMNKSPFTETSKDGFGNLTRALTALLMAINSIALNASEINDKTIKNLLNVTSKSVPRRYLKMFEQLQLLFGEIVHNKNFYAPNENDAKLNDAQLLAAKGYPDYLLRPASTLSSVIDLANKIHNCIRKDENFPIATIVCLNHKSPLFIHFHVDEKTEKFVFHMGDHKKFDEIDGVCKHALLPQQPNNGRSIAHNSHGTFNSKNQKTQLSVNARPDKRDPNCNNSESEKRASRQSLNK